MEVLDPGLCPLPNTVVLVDLLQDFFVQGLVCLTEESEVQHLICKQHSVSTNADIISLKPPMCHKPLWVGSWNDHKLTDLYQVIYFKWAKSRLLKQRVHFWCIYTILPKVLGHPLLMKGMTTLVISRSTNLNV